MDKCDRIHKQFLLNQVTLLPISGLAGLMQLESKMNLPQQALIFNPEAEPPNFRSQAEPGNENNTS